MSFVFASIPAKSNAARKIHIQRLYDVLQISIQRNDFARATRAWTILARCKEVNWRTMWNTGVHILAEDLDPTERNEKKIDFLRVMMLQNPEDRETILKELVLRLILSDQHREALDELELYLPSLPYQDNPTLHVYAGLLSLYLAQPGSNALLFDPALLRDAQSHFERAKALDSENMIAEAYLLKVRRSQAISNTKNTLEQIQKMSNAAADQVESDDELQELSSDNPRQKRMRTDPLSANV